MTTDSRKPKAAAVAPSSHRGPARPSAGGPSRANTPQKRHSAKPKSQPRLRTKPSARQPDAPTKQARLIEALESARGASIAQLTELTGWQAHTVRGSISGVLRKKLGLKVLSEPSSDTRGRVYRIVAPGGA